MRALYIGSQNPNSCALMYAEALKELGMEVTVFDPNYFDTDSFYKKVHLKLMKAPASSSILRADQKLLQLAKTSSFDLVLVIAENFLSQETLQEFRSLQSKTQPLILYHSHDNNFSKGILKPENFWNTLASYDSVFTTKSQNVSKYRALGQKNSTYLPSAFDPKVHRPVPDSESRFKQNAFNLSFIGTYDKSRDPVFDTLDWENLKIWGNNWDRSRHFDSHKEKITPHAIYGHEYADVTSHSKISLGLLRTEAEDRHTQRTFEIPACGSLQIAPRNEEILSYFEEDKEIVCFDSLEELNEKIAFYLKNASAREKIAVAGFKRVKESGHTYFDRVQQMLDTVGISAKIRQRG